MKSKVLQQKGTGGSSAYIGYATGSGSRPKGAKFTIPSSQPMKTQQLRPKNKIDNS